MAACQFSGADQRGGPLELLCSQQPQRVPHQHGHTVSLVNPRRTRHYADSRLVRTQNDTIDAALIADFFPLKTPSAG